MYLYSTPSKEIIFGQLSKTAKRQVTEDHITIVSVKPNSDSRGDTVIRLRAVDFSIFEGERDYFYNRHPIENVVSGLDLSVPYAEYVNSYEVLSALNAKYGFNFTFDEIIRNDYPTKKATYYELTFAPTCLIWYGTLKIYKDHAPNSLANVIVPNVQKLDLVTGFKRGKITGSLVYAPYEFDSQRTKLALLRNGEAQELQVLEILQATTTDPWVFLPATPADYNLAGCKLETLVSGVYSIVRVHLSTSCLNVGGYLELKYR